ncbi:MAG TPA: hypothetical protein VGD62_02265 [Acidobacteriaceae bacterium]
MDLKSVKISSQGVRDAVANVVPEDFPWTRNIAAASLVAGAVLLVAGKRRTALAVATAGAAITLLERPEAAQELWASLPTYIRQGQDFLVRAEGVIEKLGDQAMRLRESIARAQG